MLNRTILKNSRMFKKIKVLFTQKRVDFREAYEKLPVQNQLPFRHAVMSSQGWQTKMSFYNAMNGKAWLNEKAIKDIHYLLNKFAK